MRIKTAEWRDLLRRQAAACDIGLTDKAVALLETFASELVAWNQKVNLTAIIDPAEVIEKSEVRAHNDRVATDSGVRDPEKGGIRT